MELLPVAIVIGLLAWMSYWILRAIGPILLNAALFVGIIWLVLYFAKNM